MSDQDDVLGGEREQALDLLGEAKNDIDLNICVPTPIEGNNDGVPDGLDTNCDGTIDISFGAPSMGGGHTPKCDPVIDSNGDGIPDGLDLNCDGVIDYKF